MRKFLRSSPYLLSRKRLTRSSVLSLHLSNCKTDGGKKISAWRLFNYTNLHQKPPPNEEPSGCSEQGKPGGKAVAREPPAPFHPFSLPPPPPPPCLSSAAICLFSSRRCNPLSYEVLSLLADSYFTDAI